MPCPDFVLTSARNNVLKVSSRKVREERDGRPGASRKGKGASGIPYFPPLPGPLIFDLALLGVLWNFFKSL